MLPLVVVLLLCADAWQAGLYAASQANCGSLFLHWGRALLTIGLTRRCMLLTCGRCAAPKLACLLSEAWIGCLCRVRHYS